MDNIDAYNIEFIDLSDVEETERNWIINSLHTWDPNVKVPWKKNYYQPPVKRAVSSVPLQHIPNNVQVSNCNVPPPNFILTANMNDRNNVNPLQQHQQIYPMYQVTAAYPPNVHIEVPLPYQKQPNYSNIPYVQRTDSFVTAYPQQIPQTSQNLMANVVVNNNTNYPFNSVNANVEITQDLSNTTEQKSVTNGQLESVTKHADKPAKYYASTLNASPIINHESWEGDGTPKVTKKEYVPKSAGKSWASLFSPSSNNVVVETKEINQENTNQPLVLNRPFIQDTSDTLPHDEADGDDVKIDLKSNYNDPVFYILGEYLCEYSLDHRTISLQPRGLINRSNYCYINSILQALLACPPVYNLLNSLSEKVTTTEMKKLLPVIDHMAKFVKEFQYLPAGQRVSRRVDKNQKLDPNSIINCDIPFEPNYIYKMLNGMRSDTFVIEGRQEDAEEFLGCLLNGLNDEMLELMKLVGKKVSKPVTEIVNVESDIDKEWQVMGPKNKGCVTRRTEVIQTPISDIFNGHLRSRVHRTGDKSTDNIQPFFTLQLNIEKVSTVREALEALVCKNQLEGVTSSRTNEEVEAWQQVTVEELPYVLILHLKCFDFKLDGCTKIMKALEFPIDLKIDSKLLSSKTNYSPKEKQYKLFAVVYHDGKEATKGHYITDAYHVGYGRWVRYDDSSVKAVPEDQVLKPHGTRVPYLLFYRRSDSIRSK